MYPLAAAATQEAESSRKLTHLLNAVTDALVWVIAKSGIPSQQQPVRLANLLMLLSHVRHARYNPCGGRPLDVWGVGWGRARALRRPKSFGESVCKFESDKVESLPLKEDKPLKGNGRGFLSACTCSQRPAERALHGCHAPPYRVVMASLICF